MLIFYAGKYVNAVTAEDLVQDVFLKVWQKRTFLFLKEGIKTYLYRSVQHACLDYLKHQEVKGDYINAVTTKLKIEEIYYNDDPQSLFAEDERLELIYKVFVFFKCEPIELFGIFHLFFLSGKIHQISHDFQFLQRRRG